MFSFLWDLLLFFVSLGILVSVHEWGHFAVARLCGIKVLRFSLGFGPLLFKHTGKNGCEYAFSAILLGGYVKMLDENESGVKNSPESFQSKSVAQKAAVIAAGPICNIVLAVIIYTIVNICGIQTLKPVVGDVIPHSLAAEAEFAPYDLIESIDGEEVRSWSEVTYDFIAKAAQSTPVEVRVKGDLGEGATRNLNLNLRFYDIRPSQNPLELLGLRPCNGTINNVLTYVDPKGAAYAAGIREGDSIVEVNGQKMQSWYRVSDSILASNGASLNLAVKREGKIYSTYVIPQTRYIEKKDKTVPFIGVGVSVDPIPGLYYEVQYGPFEAMLKALGDTYNMSKLVVVLTSKTISGAISTENVSGPIALARGASESADIGIIYFISFLAAISVNLGIFNLLPIPVLDGGQLLFLVYEAIMHRPPSEKMQRLLTSISVTLLIMLMAFAVFNDIRAL
jgi:regulator of sigma E protease